MRLLVDECAGPALARWLREQGYDVFSVFDEARGMDDDNIIKQAFSENRILITTDKDFGEKVFREQHPHRGIVLLRLNDERAANKIKAVKRLLQSYSSQLPDCYIVVTDNQVRFAQS
ncbi:DUF5615 family PIN-like protein [Chloroflexi bacterium TSY]|nr:DUF5615 family PIN-like protein [Chloroflexi bacterium TSY]